MKRLMTQCMTTTNWANPIRDQSTLNPWNKIQPHRVKEHSDALWDSQGIQRSYVSNIFEKGPYSLCQSKDRMSEKLIDFWQNSRSPLSLHCRVSKRPLIVVP